MFSSIQNTNEIMCVQPVAVGTRSVPAWIPWQGCSGEGNNPAVPQPGCVAAPGKRPLALRPLEPLLTANANGRLVPSRTNNPESAARSLQALPLLPHTEGPLETRECVLSSFPWQPSVRTGCLHTSSVFPQIASCLTPPGRPVLSADVLSSRRRHFGAGGHPGRLALAGMCLNPL